MDLFGATVAPIVAFFLFGELAILVMLLLSFVLARRHKGSTHHYLTLAAFLADIIVFKPLMLSRASSAWGSFPWEGTRILPHLAISLSAAVLGAFAIFLGFKHRVRKGSRMFLPPKGKLHKRIGLLFIVVYAIALAVGLVIFIETYFP